LDEDGLSLLVSTIILIAATLLGVAVGGLVSYRVSVALDNRAREARAAIRRKAKLYTPLRREALALASELEDQAQLFSVRTEDAFGSAPSFLLWEDMKHDGRAASAAASVRETMDGLTATIQTYNDAVQSADAALDAPVEPFQRELNPKWQGGGSVSSYALAEMVLPAPSVRERPPGASLLAVDITATPERKQQRDRLAKRLLRDVETDASFSAAKAAVLAAREALLRQIQTSVAILDQAMRNIAKKYEREPRED
jgi:hypothetical protein